MEFLALSLYDIMFAMLIANATGLLLFLFLFWKRLKDDYQYEIIFNLSLYVLGGLGLGLLITNYFLNSYWFWIVALFIIFGFLIGIKKCRVRFYEAFDGLVVGLFSWLALFYLTNSIVNSNLFAFLAFWVTCLLIFTFFLLDSKYRSFYWYMSGRVGISGLLTLALFCLSRLIVSFFKPTFISISPFEGYISGTFAFVLFLLLYNLSRKT